MTRRRLRVLHLLHNLNYGGMERVVAEIVRRTDQSRFETHVMALGYLGHFSEGLGEFATLHLARPMGPSSMLHPRTLVADIRAVAPDVVHVHSGVWYKASLASKLAGVPLTIYTDHGRQNPDPWINRAIDRKASSRTDVIVAVSEQLAAHMKAFVTDATRVRVIANGVDTERYTPSPDDGTLRAELGVTPSTPILGSVGRLEPVKGFEVMVAAFARLRARWTDGPAPILVVIGDGSERAALERQATDARIQDAIHFLGWRSDIADVIHAFDVFTMSSHSEGTSVSLLEAMSAGVCPVVTNVGGNAAVLGDALAHRLVPQNDPDALAAAWHGALCDTARRNADALAARERVLASFALEAMVERYEALYDTAHAAHLAP